MTEGRPKRKANAGSFKAGPDKRRHVFTEEERRRGGINGFQAAIESIIIRHPEKVHADGRHIACTFMKWVKKK